MLARLSYRTRLMLFLLVGTLAVISGCCPVNSGAKRLQCSNNLKQIGLAMHQYNVVHGSFPPAYVADDKGNPLYSWRVLLLPFLEQSNLYDIFDKEQPWDSPQNISLVDRAPPPYQCPSARREDASCTDYAVVVGPETMFPGDEGLEFSAFKDGTVFTIMAIELRDSKTHWAQPDDITMEELLSQGTDADNSGGSYHYGGMNVLFADGSVYFIPEDTPNEELRAMLTRNGGEKVDLP